MCGKQHNRRNLRSIMIEVGGGITPAPDCLPLFSIRRSYTGAVHFLASLLPALALQLAGFLSFGAARCGVPIVAGVLACGAPAIRRRGCAHSSAARLAGGASW